MHGIVVREILASVKVVQGTGRAVHNNRPGHGFALYYGGESVYKFSCQKTIRVQKGELIYLPKGSCYTVSFPSGYSPTEGCYAINFNVFNDFSCAPFKIKIKKYNEILRCFKECEHHFRQKGAGDAERCMAELYSVICEVQKELSSAYSPSKELSLIMPAVEFINRNLCHGDISVEALAELCGISQSYLRRLFVSYYGVPPVIYVKNARLNYAYELLKSGECSVTLAAQSSGFNDISYFSREFKKLFGIKPSEIA